VHPGGWPVCVDKVKAWGGKPDADIFLGAGAPAHEVLKQEGLFIPYRPKHWDKIPAEWHGMKVKDNDDYWTCFAPWIVTNLYNEKILKKLRLPPPKTWNELLDPIYRGTIVHTLPYASGTMHETVEILLQAFGEQEAWKYLRLLPAFAGVFAFIIFFGKYGTLNLLLVDSGLIDKPLNFIYGFHGLVFIQSLHMLPFIVLGLSAGFTNIDPAFEEAAEVEGASGFRRFFTITLPLCTPSYLAGAVLVFLWPFTDWLTPLILGQVDFLPSVAYINIAYHFTDIHRKYMGIVAVVISSLVCIGLFLLARWWVERKKYTGLSKGTTSEGRVIEPGPLVKSGAYMYMIFITILVLLIPIVLGLAAFSRRWTLEPFPTYWTLENFRVILLESPLLVKNSFLFSGIALIFGITFGLPVAYLIVRTQVPGKDALDFVITLMLHPVPKFMLQ
jgi:ABC-type spermidine/putrescine transport system permease subunit I